MRALIGLMLMLALTACKETPQAPTSDATDSRSSNAQGEKGERGEKGEKGDPGPGLSANAQTTCRRIITVNGADYRLTLRQTEMSSGDIFVSCEVAIRSFSVAGFAIAKASEIASAKCETLYDVDGNWATASYGTWEFTPSDRRVVYEDSSSPFDGEETTFVSGDCN